jgi:hypothetical protein
MATKTYYLANATSDSWQRLVDGTPQTAATIVGGWVVGTGATNHSEFQQGVERAASTFVNTTPPDGTLDTTLFDAFRSESALSGDFASADWTFSFALRAVTNASGQDLRIRFRIIKADADGSNATEITSGQQQGSEIVNLTTTADGVSSLTFNPGAFSLSNQYLFIQIACERTGAATMTNADANFRTGSSGPAGTHIITSDFTGPTGPAAGLRTLSLTSAGI